MSDDAISQSYFSRRPYTVTYFDVKGEKQTLTRRPPPALHNMLPKDVVELTNTKNADWQSGDEFVIKHINPRHPNTIQIMNEDGESTFVDHVDLEIEEMIAPRPGFSPPSVPDQNRYLLWP